MKIVLAQSAGFCFGVRSAVDRISISLRKHRKIQIDGDLIHNPQTTAILAQRGLEKTEMFQAGTPAAIRTHGITSLKLKQIYADKKTIYNLTCPKVSRIQGLIRKYSRNGSYVLLVGDEGHPEVISLKSYAESGISVIHRKEDLDSIPHKQKKILISQTTIDRALFEEMKTYVLTMSPDCIVFDTICDSTGNKQSELRIAIQNGADTVIVIGGKHSANTKSLASIAQTAGIRTLHIETADELNPSDFINSRYVFVTAGASTPDWAIQDAVSQIREARIINRSPLLAVFSRALDALFYLNLPSAAGVFLLIAFYERKFLPAAAGAFSFLLLSYAAEHLLIPFTRFSDRRRASFWISPSAFIKKGSADAGSGNVQNRFRGCDALILKTAAALIPAVIAAVLSNLLSAAVIFTFIAAGFIARELRDARTDLVTGKISFASDSVFFKAGLILTLVTVTGTCAFFYYKSPGAGAAIPLICSIASYPDTGSYLLCRREDAQTCSRISESVRAAAALAILMIF